MATTFHCWANFHCTKWPNNEQIIQPSGHTAGIEAEEPTNSFVLSLVVVALVHGKHFLPKNMFFSIVSNEYDPLLQLAHTNARERYKSFLLSERNGIIDFSSKVGGGE